MLVSIQHEIDLIYSELISESTMDLHLVPRIDAHQTLREFSLLVDPRHQSWIISTGKEIGFTISRSSDFMTTL